MDFASEPGKHVISPAEISLAYCLSKRLDLEICFIGLRAITHTRLSKGVQNFLSRNGEFCYHIEFYQMTTSWCATDIVAQGICLVPSTLSRLISWIKFYSNYLQFLYLRTHHVCLNWDPHHQVLARPQTM
jgi:hypothetical protein